MRSEEAVSVEANSAGEDLRVSGWRPWSEGGAIFGYLVHLVAVNSLMDSKIMFLWVSWPFLVIRVGRNVLCDFLCPLCKWNSCYLNVYYAQDAGPFRVYWLCTVIHLV